MHVHRSASRFAAGLILAGLLAGLIATPASVAALRDNGITSDTSYESPGFGYEVEWDDPWVADESETETSRDGDSLTLTSDGAFMSILGFAYTGDPAEAVAVIVRSLEENADVLEVVDESGDAELATAEVVFDLDGTAVGEYIEARPVGGGASIVVTLTSPTAFYHDELESAGDVVELDGDPIFSAIDPVSTDRDRDREDDEDEDGARTGIRDEEDEDTGSDGRDRELADDEDTGDEDDGRTFRTDEDEGEDQDTRANDDDQNNEDEDRNNSRRAGEDQDEDRQRRAPSGVDGSAYVSPTYGYSLEWDREWEFIEDSEMVANGRTEMDQVGIFNGTSAVYVAGRADYDGNAASCVEGEAAALAATGGIDEVEILTGEDGEPLGVAGGEFGFGLYSLISAAGDGPIVQIVYVECRRVVPDEAVVSMVAAMPIEEFEAEFEAVMALSGALIVDAR